MKIRFSLLLFLFGAPLFVCAQEEAPKKITTMMSAGEKRAKITAQAGYYNAYNYNNVKPGENFSLDFAYMLSGTLSFGQHMNFGRNRYYEQERSNFPTYNLLQDSTNADILTIQVGITVGYTYPLSRFISITALTGLSTYSETIMYPIFGKSSNGKDLWGGYQQETRTLIAVPLLFSVQYIISPSFEIGLRGGIYVSPQESLIGKHFGPHISFKF